MRLLVVEDDPNISEPLCSGLRREGFEVIHVDTGAAALDHVSEADLVLLDLGLPDLDGRAVCRQIRTTSSLPIIVVSARGDELDRVTLLELGADDYVVKPFGFRELAARIGAVLRRTSAAGATGQASRDDTAPITVGELVVDVRSRTAAIGGTAVELTPREFDLLAYLAADAGAVKTRDEIMRDVWDEHWWGSTKTLDVHVAALRKKVGADLIRTVRRVGFVVAEPS